MARRSAEVTVVRAKDGSIPECANAGVALLRYFSGRWDLEKLGEHLRIRRKGGFCAVDGALYLLLYFASGLQTGLKDFWESIGPCNREIAATVYRAKLASPSALSRLLSAVELGLLRPEVTWLLTECTGIDAVLRHASVLTYDALGVGWHVFDFDPTVTTLRQRALPHGKDLPEPRRKAANLAAPGHAGRKRGDVQVRRGTVQHAGSSAWLHAMLGPGNSDGHAELKAALEVVVATCKRLGHALEHALLRMDGEFGWVPYLTMCRAFGVRCMTRLTRFELFNQANVMRTLLEGTWHYVPDSGCDPRRSALDLGIVTVPPGQDTRKEDGTKYDPIAVRVVVSRYPRKEKAEHGRVIDGWQYEMFAMDVDSAALPPEEAIAMFFGRARLENGFAQEDREIGLDQILSYHLPGQEFAVLIGLWVWNLQLVLGFEQEPPPDVRPIQTPYVAQVDTRGTAITAPIEAPPDPAASSIPADQVMSPEVSTGTARAEAPLASLDSPRPSSSSNSSDVAGLQMSVPIVDIAASAGLTPGDQLLQEALGGDARAKTTSAPAPAADDLLEALRGIDWEQTLRTRPGWSWNPTTGRLQCPDGRELVLTTVRKGEHAPGRIGIVFCRPVAGCEQCGPRPACLHSAGTRTSKHFELSVPTDMAIRLRNLLLARRVKQPAEALPRTVTQRPKKRSRRPFSITPITPFAPSTSTPSAATVVCFAVLSSLFLAAPARHVLRSAMKGVRLTVEMILPPPPPPAPLLIAKSVEERQHRRKTWQQNFERHALHPDAQVRIEFAGRDALLRLLGETPERAIG